jgi:hypothetical protein
VAASSAGPWSCGRCSWPSGRIRWHPTAARAAGRLVPGDDLHLCTPLAHRACYRGWPEGRPARGRLPWGAKFGALLAACPSAPPSQRVLHGGEILARGARRARGPPVPARPPRTPNASAAPGGAGWGPRVRSSALWAGHGPRVRRAPLPLEPLAEPPAEPPCAPLKCQPPRADCRWHGVVEPATQVEHVIGLVERPDLAFDPAGRTRVLPAVASRPSDRRLGPRCAAAGAGASQHEPVRAAG